MNLILGQCNRQSDESLLDEEWFQNKRIPTILSIVSLDESIDEEQHIMMNDLNDTKTKYNNQPEYLESVESMFDSLAQINQIMLVLRPRFQAYPLIIKKINDTVHNVHVFQVLLTIVKELLTNCTVSSSNYLTQLKKTSEDNKELQVKACLASQVNIQQIGQLSDELMFNIFPRMLRLHRFTQGNADKINNQLLFELRVTQFVLDIVNRVFGSAIDHSPDDIVGLSKDHEKWQKLLKVCSFKKLADARQMQKSYDSFTKTIRIAHTLIFKGSDYDSKIMKSSIFVLGSIWYFFQNEKIRQRSTVHNCILQPESAGEVMNLLELPGIKHMMKLGLQMIATNIKIYIDPVVTPFTKDIIAREKRDNTLNQITISPLQFVNMCQHNSPSEKTNIYLKSSQKVRIRLLCFERLQKPLAIQWDELDMQDGYMGRLYRGLGIKQQKQKIFEIIIIHVHGGGFMSMSSGSHQYYTREWANKLKVPIFSIDYSLAPKYPYPAALDDCWQAYQWILTYLHQHLNIQPKRIILAGDSAGGNLCCALTALAIKYGCQVPHGIFLAYPSLNLKFQHSTSHLKALKDGILSLSILNICITAYTGYNQQNSDPEDDPFISPSNLSDEILQQFPPVRIMCGENDPVLDHSYRFADRLLYIHSMIKRNNKVDVKMLEYEGLSHAFLSFYTLTGMKEVSQCVRDSIDMIQYLIDVLN